MGNQIVSSADNLDKGGAVFRTSSGTVCAVVYNGSGIAVYKDVDGTPSLVGSAQTDETVHGTGASIAALDACIDSADKVHIISVASNYGQTRDVAYNTLTGIDGTPSWGTWAAITALNEEPTYPSCVIDVDADDYPRAIWTDEYFYKGAYYSGPYYSHDVGSGWITKERVDTTDQHCSMVYGMAVEYSTGDVEVIYSSGTVYYRRRNGSWGTRGSLSNGSLTLKGSVQIDGTTVYRYSVDGGSAIYENDSSIGADPEGIGAPAKLCSAGIGSDGTRYVIYKDDTDNYLAMYYNSGSGWTSGGDLEETVITYCIAAKGLINNTPSGTLDYIYSIGTTIYYGEYDSGGGSTDVPVQMDHYARLRRV